MWPVGGFLASRLDIDLNSERFAACAGLRSACKNNQSRHGRDLTPFLTKFGDSSMMASVSPPCIYRGERRLKGFSNPR